MDDLITSIDGLTERFKNEIVTSYEINQIINKQSDIASTPGIFLLHFVLYSNAHIDIVRAILDAGANVNEKYLDISRDPLSTDGRTPLYIACERKLPIEVIELLLNRGANPEIPYLRCKTPIMLVLNNYEYLKLLIEAGAKLDVEEFQGYYVLERMLSIEYEHADSIIKNCIYLKAKISIKCLEKCLFHLKDYSLIEIIIGMGVNVFIENDEDNLAIRAIKKCDIELFKFYIKLGLKIDGYDHVHNTPLLYYVTLNYEFAKLLIEMGVPVHITSRIICSPLLCAMQLMNKDMVELFCDNLTSEQLGIQLCFFSENLFDIENGIARIIVRYLKTNVRYQDRTLLHELVKYDVPEIIIEKLAEIGANDVDINGKIPLHVCQRDRYIKYLIKGKNVNARDNYGYTPLHYIKLTRVMFNLLILNGANPFIKSKTGAEPYRYHRRLFNNQSRFVCTKNFTSLGRVLPDDVINYVSKFIF